MSYLIKPGRNFINNKIPFNDNYRFERLTAPYIEQVVDVFTYAFCYAEPMTHYLKMDEKKYKIFSRAVVNQAVKDQLSVIALDGNQVIALALTEDVAAPGPLPDFDNKFIYILALLEKLGEKFFKDKKFTKGNLAHLFITAVDKKYRHQGLSTQVNFLAMDLAAQRQFSYMYCELTHPYNEFGITHHLQNPKSQIGDITYNKFNIDGYYPFPNLSGSARSYLWAIRDNPQLCYEEKINVDENVT